MDATLDAALASFDLGAAPIGGLTGTFNAADFTIDAGDVSTPEPVQLELTLNASDGRLVLPDGNVDAQVTLNASSLVVCVPGATGLRVEYSDVLGSDDLASSWLELVAQNVWQTREFDAAQGRIDMDVTNAISTFSVVRPEVCSSSLVR